MILRLVSRACGILLFSSGLPSLASGGTPDKEVEKAATAEVDLFHTGALELQIMSGLFFSVQQTHSARPNTDYALTVVRLGYMLDTPRGTGFFRGNDEVALEVSGAPIFQGPGTAFGGASLLYRRNFVQPGSCFIPYVGINLGGTYSDIYHNRVQHSVGAPFDFNLGANVGVRVRLGKTPWSIDAEAAYRHISDAGITNRNDGIDAIGGLVGFSRFF